MSRNEGIHEILSVGSLGKEVTEVNVESLALGNGYSLAKLSGELCVNESVKALGNEVGLGMLGNVSSLALLLSDGEVVYVGNCDLLKHDGACVLIVGVIVIKLILKRVGVAVTYYIKRSKSAVIGKGELNAYLVVVYVVALALTGIAVDIKVSETECVNAVFIDVLIFVSCGGLRKSVQGSEKVLGTVCIGKGGYREVTTGKVIYLSSTVNLEIAGLALIGVLVNAKYEILVDKLIPVLLRIGVLAITVEGGGIDLVVSGSVTKNVNYVLVRANVVLNELVVLHLEVGNNVHVSDGTANYVNCVSINVRKNNVEVANVNVGYVLFTNGTVTVEVKHVYVSRTQVTLSVSVRVGVNVKLTLLIGVGTGSDLPVMGVVISPLVLECVNVTKLVVTNVTLSIFVRIGMCGNVSLQLCVLAGSCVPVVGGAGGPLVTVGVLTSIVVISAVIAQTEDRARSKGKNHERYDTKER